MEYQGVYELFSGASGRFTQDKSGGWPILSADQPIGGGVPFYRMSLFGEEPRFGGGETFEFAFVEVEK
jgi:hypothetical protein